MAAVQKKSLYTSDYVSDRVFDGVRKISKAKADKLRATYLRYKDKAQAKKQDQQKATN